MRQILKQLYADTILNQQNLYFKSYTLLFYFNKDVFQRDYFETSMIGSCFEAFRLPWINVSFIMMEFHHSFSFFLFSFFLFFVFSKIFIDGNVVATVFLTFAS